MTKIYRFLAIPVALAVLALGSFGGIVEAQTASPRVQIQLASNGLTSPLSASMSDATVARLALNTTGSSEAVTITNLPFILTTGNGAIASTLNNCRVYNEATGNALATVDGSATLAAGMNNIVLSSSELTVPANTTVTLALRCNVAANLVAGGTYTFSMNADDVIAAGASTNVPAIVTVPGGVVVVPPVVNVPGLPTTGADAEAAMNLATLVGLAFAISLVGFAAIRKQASRA